MSSDPLIPLVRRDDDDFERSLLRAGKSERAAEGADRRLLAVLGVGAGGASGGLAAKSAAKLGTNGVLASIAVLAVVAAGIWVSTSSSSRPAPAPMPVVVQPLANDAPPPSASTPVESIPSMRVEDLPSPPSVVAPKPTVTTHPAPDLAREVALLQIASKDLKQDDAPEALRTLDTYDHEFPAGSLVPESQVLRIEALVHAGDTARAQKLGDAFLTAHPSGPGARRVRSALDQIR